MEIAKDSAGRQRIVLHVDMDSFFASCEERRDPSLRGKPVVVGADPMGGAGRGVVSTANYAARGFGIRSGMPISRAFGLCPGCVFLPVDFALYNEYSERVMGILKAHASRFEQAGIDEAYLELSGAKGFSGAEGEAREIKREISAETGLTASVGIARNKVVAKVASDFRKPDGLTAVPPGGEAGFLAPLPVRRLPWVGKKTEEALRRIGVETVGQLAARDAGELFGLFGKAGPQLKALATGVDESPLVESWVQKSIGAQKTFQADTADREKVFGLLSALARDVFSRLERENAFFSTVTVTVRFSGFQTVSRARTLKEPSRDEGELLRAAFALAGGLVSGGRPVRLVGVRVSGLVRERGQTTLGEFQGPAAAEERKKFI
jgi:DNA polymerase IV (DinB-like DNA polymerase)